MPVPVITVHQMREWEKATWSAGQTETEVIRRVGRALANRAGRLVEPGGSILILAGKGHNGDDARAAAEQLAGHRIDLLNAADPEADLGRLDASLAQRPALIIDGLFGIGLNRPLDAGWIEYVRRVNRARACVLAVDVPSGLNAETGEPQGAAIEATVTLTVGAPKRGMLESAAWPFVGRLEVTPEVGLVPCPLRGELNWMLPEDFKHFPPRRAAGAHKGSFGHLAIVAGSVGCHGAAVLAARGAQRARPGLITLLTQEQAYHAVAPQLQAVMVRPWGPAAKLPEASSAMLIGPGLAAPEVRDDLRATVRRLWHDVRWPVVVDASGLDGLLPGAAPDGNIRVITPHPGEAARLLQTSPQQIQANRLQALRDLSRRFGGCWVVLKGHQTLVGRSTGEVFVNATGNPHLAQGGSGDVLAGFIGGLLAQPALQDDPVRALTYAVWQHGAAADLLEARRSNWIVEDLLDTLGDVRAPHSDAG